MMNTDKLRNIISKKAHGDSDISQKFYQLFYFERILERISMSNYRGQIILKGGLLLTSIIGNDERTTKDMDATLKGIPLTKKDVERVFHEILHIPIDDGVSFQIISIKDIRLEDEYSGFNVNLKAEFDGLKTNLLIDITTGDVITYKEVEFKYYTLFDDEAINIMTYNYETIIAEKFETIIFRNIDNTRMKDYYDLYMFGNLKWNEINKDILRKAIINTSKKRNTENYIEDANSYIEMIQEDDRLKSLWNSYVSNYEYAKDITFEDTINAIKVINELVVPSTVN